MPSPSGRPLAGLGGLRGEGAALQRLDGATEMVGDRDGDAGAVVEEDDRGASLGGDPWLESLDSPEVSVSWRPTAFHIDEKKDQR